MRHKPIHQAQAIREKALSLAMRRKEEYLGARVSKELREKVIQRAKELDIPVSILLRNVLEEVFGSQGGGAGDRADSRRDDQGERFSSVLGWEHIRLNKQVDCHGCGKRLAPGVSAVLGLTQPGEGYVILCDQCKDLA